MAFLGKNWGSAEQHGIGTSEIINVINSKHQCTAFSEKLWCGLLDYATAYADGRLAFTFKNGSTFES